MAVEFMSKLPTGFQEPLKKRVVTLEAMNKVKLGDTNAHVMEKLDVHLLLVSQNRGIELCELFSYELYPMPSSLFYGYGDMRKGNKAILVNKLVVIATAPLFPSRCRIGRRQ